MEYITFIVITLLSIISECYSIQHNDISATFIILNQNEKGHIQRARNLRDEIMEFPPSNATVEALIATDVFPHDAFWTYFPIMEKLTEMNSKWYIFLEEYTGVDVQRLVSLLLSYHHLENQFMGKMLVDRQPTIIHHFDTIAHKNGMPYPDLRAGFVMSNQLIKKVASVWSSSVNNDFNIDPSYELSKFIVDFFGTAFRHHPQFCTEKRNNCLLWHLEAASKASAELNSIYFAIKTCKSLAPERIPLIKDTWLMDASRHQLYSDVQDTALGTIDIGITNTERGHCKKTFEIIRQASKLKDIKWLAIVDDDTLINVRRLASFLGRYPPTEKLALGERYGYMQAANKGFSYITGGGGIILSFPLVSYLSKSGVCSCPSPDSPDDMILGACLARLKVPIIHSARFHQARVDDYPIELLRDSNPISFHKFWMLNVRQSYKLWLANDNHDEL